MIWFIVGFLISATLFFHIGWYGKDAYKLLKRLVSADKSTESYVTVGTPALGKAPMGQTSQIVTPLPPSVMKAREDEELRKMRYS